VERRGFGDLPFRDEGLVGQVVLVRCGVDPRSRVRRERGTSLDHEKGVERTRQGVPEWRNLHRKDFPE